MMHFFKLIIILLIPLSLVLTDDNKLNPWKEFVTKSNSQNYYYCLGELFDGMNLMRLNDYSRNSPPLIYHHLFESLGDNGTVFNELLNKAKSGDSLSADLSFALPSLLWRLGGLGDLCVANGEYARINPEHFLMLLQKHGYIWREKNYKSGKYEVLKGNPNEKSLRYLLCVDDDIAKYGYDKEIDEYNNRIKAIQNVDVDSLKWIQLIVLEALQKERNAHKILFDLEK